MATRYCQQQIQWIVMNSLYLRVAAALIIAVGIAGLIGGTVLCRGNTIEIINGDSVQGIYPEMGLPVIVFSLFVETVGIILAFIVCVISRKTQKFILQREIGTMGMKTGISAFARANAFCCQLASTICFIVAFGLIIGGSVLIDKNSNVLYRRNELCEDFNLGLPPSGGPHLWNEICDNFSTVQRNFAIGIAMVFFGCVFVVIASVTMCCACGFLAFSDSTKSVITVTQQPQLVNQMPMGSYSNHPKPPPVVATGYQLNQSQMPVGCPIQSTPYPIGPVYSMPPTVPPPYDQAAEAPDLSSMPTEKY